MQVRFLCSLMQLLSAAAERVHGSPCASPTPSSANHSHYKQASAVQSQAPSTAKKAVFTAWGQSSFHLLTLFLSVNAKDLSASTHTIVIHMPCAVNSIRQLLRLLIPAKPWHTSSILVYVQDMVHEHA